MGYKTSTISKVDRKGQSKYEAEALYSNHENRKETDDWIRATIRVSSCWSASRKNNPEIYFKRDINKRQVRLQLF